MHKTVQQVVFTAAIFLTASSAGRAQQSNSAQVSEDLASIVPVIMAEVNNYGKVQKDTQSGADAAVDLASINSTSDLTTRLKDLDAYIGATTDMVAILRAAPVLAVYEARNKGLDDTQQIRAFELMDSSLEAAGATQIVRKMQADRRYFQGWSGLLAMLRDNPGLWSTKDGDTLPISFKNSEFEAAFWVQVDAILQAEKDANRKADEVDAAKSEGD
ncbi:MAG: hypothetical protein GXP05_00025 [Alphaproteobacteria bacterium]|nr:hypothetical protein [Alphaproteobacteria bacterium]